MARKRKKLTSDQLAKREQQKFSRKIQATFKNAGFQYLPTNNKEVKFGAQTGDLDAVFLYENILLVCEETTSKGDKIKEHLKKKKIFFDEVEKNKPELVKWLKADYKDRFEVFEEYTDNGYTVFYLYFTKNRFNPDDEVIEQFKPIIIVEDSSLLYLNELSANIKLSARHEVFRFLGLRSKDIGVVPTAGVNASIDTNIIYPDGNTGLNNGVRMVSFMMSADDLIKNSFVLRKDNWEKAELYQRLIKKNRIQNIRKHLAEKKRAFMNNIIVSLPPGVRFSDEDGNTVKLEDIKTYDKKYTLSIPNEFNTICIIDGQHRVFAHYEADDVLEKDIRPLRKKLHLLVTGLIFPDSMKEHEQRKFESEIFLDINSNAKPVPPDVLLFIKTLQDPFSDIGISRKVLERLNQREPFHNLLQMSSMEGARIKIASIIKYALRGLVEVTDDRQDTLYYYWAKQSGKSLINSDDVELLDEYIKFVATTLSTYFGALKAAYKSEWENEESKILSTTSVNGFIIAFRHLLETEGVKDHKHYMEAFQKLSSVGFSKETFPYTSSRYRMFSRVILKECFGVTNADTEGGGPEKEAASESSAPSDSKPAPE